MKTKHKIPLSIVTGLGIIGGIANALFSSNCPGEFTAWISSSCYAVTALLLLHAPSK